MSTANLTIPSSSIETMVSEIIKYGKTDVETGGFLISSNTSPDEIVVVACAGSGEGIFRHALQFKISGLALNRLFDWATDNNYRIVAQFHSHQNEAFMSNPDKMYGLRVQGFISVIVPYYETPSQDPTVWRWWEFKDKEWLPCSAPRSNNAEIDVVYFDEGGVR
jgi:hypothetical protein